jgi:hypothetical protein
MYVLIFILVSLSIITVTSEVDRCFTNTRLSILDAKHIEEITINIKKLEYTKYL